MEEEDCGYVLPYEDPELLAKHILKLYENDELREEMGRKGRKYAEQNRSLTVAAKGCIDLIRGIQD